MRTMLTAVLAFFTAFALAACGGGVHAPAKTELNVYTALETDELDVYLADFRAKHPDIEVKLVRDSTGIITSRLKGEENNPRADVVWGLAMTSLLMLDEGGMFQGYAPEGIGRIRPQFRDQANDPPHWVGIKAWMTGIVCNETECEKLGLPIPSSFRDLLDPVYEGRLVMPNPASSGTGFLTVSAILQLNGEDAGWDFLDRLHQNMAMYTHSGSLPAKLAGTGEFPIGISFGYRGIKQKEQGQPVVTVFPEEGCGWEMEVSALVRKPEIKDAAKTFLDWAINLGLMKKYATFYPIVATELDVPPPEGYPAKPEQHLIENDFQWAAANRERIIAEWTRRYDAKSAPKD